MMTSAGSGAPSATQPATPPATQPATPPAAQPATPPAAQPPTPTSRPVPTASGGTLPSGMMMISAGDLPASSRFVPPAGATGAPVAAAPAAPMPPTGAVPLRAAPFPAPSTTVPAAQQPVVSVGTPPAKPRPEPKPEPSRAKAAGIAVKHAPGLDDQPIPGVALRFDNADIYEIIQAVMGEVLQLNYMIDPSIQGKVTLNTQGSVSSNDVYSILESVLSLSGVTIVRDGKLYKFIREPNAVRDVISATASGENSFVVRVIPVRFVQAASLVNVLRGFVSPQAAVVNDPTNRYLIVADRATNVAKVVEMMKTLDVDYLKHVSIRMVQIYKGDAAEMAKDLDALFKTSGLFNWPGTDANKVYFLPIVRMNALLVAGANSDVLDAAEHWIKTLDDDPKDGVGSQIHVYPVANSTAVHIADIINQIYGGSPSSSSSRSTSSSASSSSSGTMGGLAGAAGGDTSRVVVRGNQPAAQTTQASGSGLSATVQIIADEATNSLIIRANQQDYLQIKKVIEQIDSVPRQVLIQVMIAEVALTNQLQYGVQWWLKNIKFNKGYTAAAGLDTANNVGLKMDNPLLNSNPITSNPLPFGGIGGVLFDSAGTAMAMFDLMAADTDFNVLSAPHVLASDGKSAKIQIGSSEPIIKATTSAPVTDGFTTQDSIDYRDIGVMMEVTPHINASGLVTLNISQEVSKIRSDARTFGSGSYPAFDTRKVETDVTVEEGKTLLIAGMIQEQNDNKSDGIPLLKDIPLLGGLFGGTKKEKNKVELMIAITPYVVRNREEGDRLTREFQDSVGKLKAALGGSAVRKLDEPSVKLFVTEEKTASVEEQRTDVPVPATPTAFPAPVVTKEEAVVEEKKEKSASEGWPFPEYQ